MNINNGVHCPKCGNQSFRGKHEATYIYEYDINLIDNHSEYTKLETVPFIFEKRSMQEPKQYLECKKCSAKFHCSFIGSESKIDFSIIQKAINSDYVEHIESFK